MSLVLGANHVCDRRPCTNQTIRVDTSGKRTYEYYVIVETKLTKTSWADYLYSFHPEKFSINVKYGTINPAKVDAPASGFPGELNSNIEMYKTYNLDTGTDGFDYYEFDHFDCLGSNRQSSTPIYTCKYYNISSSNSEFKPVNQSGYQIDVPELINVGTSYEKLRIKFPTSELRNASAGNQIEFYIYGSYNNNPLDNSADGRYAAWSQKMKIDIVCGQEKLLMDGKDFS